MIIDELTKYEHQASRLVESTAHGTITADYGARAKTERRAAFWWSVGAVIVALGGLYMLARVPNRIRWSVSYLTRLDALAHPQRAHYRIAPMGRELLGKGSNPCYRDSSP